MSRPEIVSRTADLRQSLRSAERSIGFVPTMGSLHAGHAKLFEIARRENRTVVASIFVNPLQFDRPEDLDRYPRTFDTDLALCQRAGVDVVFAPGVADLYPQEQLTFVEVPALSRYLCGEFRPGHFRGVATVVLKLFNLVGPDRAYFGQKDGQQLAIIRRMVSDLQVPVDVVAVPTVREPDGLALSSRNAFLSAQERALAPLLYQAIRMAVEELTRGNRSAQSLRSRAAQILQGVRVEYFELVDPDTLMPVDPVANDVMVAGAIWLGNTRLIDNVIWTDGREAL